MTPTPRMHYTTLLIALAMSAVIGRLSDATGATITVGSINASGTAAAADQPSDVLFSPAEPSSWQPKSPAPKRIVNAERRRAASPLTQLFQAAPMTDSLSAVHNDDAYHSSVSRVLGPYLTASLLMPTCDNACLAMTPTVPTHSLNGARRWTPSTSISEASSKTAPADAASAMSPESKDVAEPVQDADASVAEASVKTLSLVLPLAIGLLVISSGALWQLMRRRRPMQSGRLSETAMGEDSEWATHSALLANVMRENRRSSQPANTKPMPASVGAKEDRRAA